MTNPFLTPSTLPYSLPPFADITDDDYGPAFEAGFAEQLAEVERIATDPAEPTFENTVAALERSGATLTRVEHVFFNKTSSDSTEATDALELDLAPGWRPTPTPSASTRACSPGCAPSTSAVTTST